MAKLVKLLLFVSLSCFAANSAMAAFSFSYSCDRPAMAGFPDSINYFYAPLINTGDDDTYILKISRDHQEGWISSLCIDSICFSDSVDWPVASGDTAWVMPDVTPIEIAGDGWLTVSVQSINNPSDEKVLNFYFTSGHSILLVCGDPNGNYTDYYQAAFDSLAVSYNNWPRWFAPITEADAVFFDKFLWFTGDAENTLTTEDFQVLSELLNTGGDLFISGQGIASDLQDSSFLGDYLHASYYQTDSGRQIDGIAGDMISDGLSFSISGAGGADNQNAPASIHPQTGSSTTLVYPDGQPAGVRYSNGVYQMVFLSFGFEAITEIDTRVALVGKIAEFFETMTDIDVPVAEIVPDRLNLLGNYPNPFNASTVIELEIPVAQEISVSVYDLSGRLVDNLYEGAVAAGKHRFTWDAGKSSTGVYYCRVSGKETKNLPMVLIK